MKNESKGLGDTIAKFTHFVGLDKLAERIAHLFGYADCGCKRRKDTLNKIVPYKKKNNKL
jgi:hypothetical protein